MSHESTEEAGRKGNGQDEGTPQAPHYDIESAYNAVEEAHRGMYCIIGVFAKVGGEGSRWLCTENEKEWESS